MIIQNYCKGKIPVRTWFFSSVFGAIGLLICIIAFSSGNLGFHLILNFLFGVFVNMIFTLPIFFFQSKIICDALQKKKWDIVNVMLVVVITGWLFQFLLGYSIYKLFLEKRLLFGGQIFLIVNFINMLLAWCIHSFYSIRKSQLN